MKEQNELEQLFSSAFDGFEVTPPSHVKAAIDESLFASKTPVHSKRGFIWLFPLIGFFFIGSFITLSFNTRNHTTKISNSSSTQLANQTNSSSVQEKHTVTHTEKQLGDNKIIYTNRKQKQGEIADQKNVSAEIKPNKIQKENEKIKVTKPASIRTESPKKGGLKNASNQSPKKSKTHLPKTDKSKQVAQKSSERSNVISHVKDEKINDNSASAGKSTEDSQTESMTSVNAENEEKAKEVLSEKQDEVASTNETPNDLDKTVDSSGSINTGSNKTSGNDPSKWSVGLYTGTFLGVNSLSTNSKNYFEMSSPLGFSSSIEVNYGLNSKWSIATGLGYSTFNERISAVIYDTTFIPNGVTIEYIYLNPALQDSIIDSIVTVNYITEIASSNVAQKINYNVFSLPIYGSFGLFNKGNWNSSILAGVRLNYYKTTVTNYYEGTPEALISTPESKQFGISAALRPEITYSFGKFGVGIYLNTSFDLIPITRWSEFDKKRYDLGGGVVLKYRF